MNTGKIILFGLALMVIFSSPSQSYIVRGNISCGEYLDAYSRSTLNSKGGWNGPYEAWQAFGFILGYISGHNASSEDAGKSGS
jgi:hypothetical protein|tara:strand:- start:457 stop:705 length:249 start_codon:yes stop_codon:yes gene_type:complete